MPYSSRLTRNQQSVLDVLSQQPHPASAQELYGVLRQQQAIGLATVYRALETLKSGKREHVTMSPSPQNRS